LSGATIVLRPSASAGFAARGNTIIGNTVLYGATAGMLFASGQAGERFAVRNSGATAVVEGCGSNGCEYMTGGTVAILGAIGDNFAAGMTGGTVYVYDADGLFEQHVNGDSVVWNRLALKSDHRQLKKLVVEHHAETDSIFAAQLLANWDSEVGRFWLVQPVQTWRVAAEVDSPKRDHLRIVAN
jgi:glutamate synthase (NADPH/NADH) large chain